jgi:signal transduction histidine kinase
MTTDPAMSGIMRRQFYVAEFQEYKGFLFLKILPYILFSFFLFGITSLAFWLIFNGLKKQQKLAEQKNEFISNVTHELKTPLTTVGVALEALDDFEVLRNPDKTREYLQISKMELERLNLLVDKVLRLSMFEQNALQMRPEWLDLAATTGQVIQAMSLQANAVGAVIRFDQQPCTLLGDKVHLTGVVYNLLDNALKYCGNNPEIDVSVRNLVKDDQCFARLEVRDNGIGIAPEYHAQVFEKFFRVPMGNVHNVKGHGLGLNYVSAVVRQHGGSIYVESQPGMGSAFIVEIPAPTPPSIA